MVANIFHVDFDNMEQKQSKEEEDQKVKYFSFCFKVVSGVHQRFISRLVTRTGKLQCHGLRILPYMSGHTL